MIFLQQLGFLLQNTLISFLEEVNMGPDDGMRGGDISNERYQELSESEREIFTELRQIGQEINMVVNAREITQDYLELLERGFARILDDVQSISEEELSNPNSDYNKLINKISILHAQIQQYIQDEMELNEDQLRLQLLDLQGQTVAALHDLMGEVVMQSDIEMTEEQRSDLFTEASESLNSIVAELEGVSEEQRQFLSQIIENAGGLENISANDIYLMRSVGIDLSSLFLINSEGRARKDTMEVGDVFLVNFGGNYSVDREIGAGDILDISQIYKVRINGVEGTRGHTPRPGYYTPDGRYLAIHDGYRIEIGEKREFDSETERQEDFETAIQSRITDFRRDQIDAWMYENIFDSDATEIEIPFVMDVDRETFISYIEEGMSEYIQFNEETGVLSVEGGYDSFRDAFSNFSGSIGDFEARPNEHLARNPAFLARLREICESLGVNPSHMLIVMRAESNINPHLENAIAVREGRPGAVGLIQFMPSTARSLETSREQLLRMSGIEQLEYVYRYFRPYAGRLNSVEDLYKATFFPAAIGQSLSWVFRSSNLSPQSIARENPGISSFSTRADGFIDGYAFRRYVQHHVSQA